MKKTLNKILVVAAGAVLLAFTITVRHAKADWQHMPAYGYDIWCDTGRFCSGPLSQMTVEEILSMFGLSYWIEDHPYWMEGWLYWVNPDETHYGICEWIPPYGLPSGVPCACMDMSISQNSAPIPLPAPLTYFFGIIDAYNPCGYAVPIS